MPTTNGASMHNVSEKLCITDDPVPLPHLRSSSGLSRCIARTYASLKINKLMLFNPDSIETGLKIKCKYLPFDTKLIVV